MRKSRLIPPLAPAPARAPPPCPMRGREPPPWPGPRRAPAASGLAFRLDSEACAGTGWVPGRWKRRAEGFPIGAIRPAPLLADLKQQAAAPGDLEGIEEQPGADAQVDQVQKERVDQQLGPELALHEDRAHALEHRRRR